jgi:hypothetical protein
MRHSLAAARWQVFCLLLGRLKKSVQFGIIQVIMQLVQSNLLEGGRMSGPHRQ